MRRLILCVLCVAVLGKSTLKPETVTRPSKATLKPEPVTTPGKATLKPEPVTTPSKPTLKPETTTTPSKPTLKPETTTTPDKPTLKPETTTTPGKPTLNPETTTTLSESTTISENGTTSGTVKPKIMGPIERAMKRFHVIPDLITTAPEKLMKINYFIKENSSFPVNLGNVIVPRVMRFAPTFSWDGMDPKTLYTICLVDLDYPSAERPTEKEFQHWLVVNMNGTDYYDGTILYDYVGPVPPINTGYHRYVFLAYQQPHELHFHETPVLTYKSIYWRTKFSLANFTQTYNLGNPIAGNFFRAKFDEFVPKLQKYLDIDTEI